MGLKLFKLWINNEATNGPNIQSDDALGSFISDLYLIPLQRGQESPTLSQSSDTQHSSKITY